MPLVQHFDLCFERYFAGGKEKKKNDMKSTFVATDTPSLSLNFVLYIIDTRGDVGSRCPSLSHPGDDSMLFSLCWGVLDLDSQKQIRKYENTPVEL
jgi:hypothetical protein